MKRFKALSKPTKTIPLRRTINVKTWQPLFPVLNLLVIDGCSSDNMEKCMEQEVDRKLPPEAADHVAYIKERDQIRMERKELK